MKKERIPYPICSVVAVFKMLIRILNTLRSRIWDRVFFLFSDYSKSTVGENEDSPKVHSFYSNGNVQKKVLSQKKVKQKKQNSLYNKIPSIYNNLNVSSLEIDFPESHILLVYSMFLNYKSEYNFSYFLEDAFHEQFFLIPFAVRFFHSSGFFLQTSKAARIASKKPSAL